MDHRKSISTVMFLIVYNAYSIIAMLLSTSFESSKHYAVNHINYTVQHNFGAKEFRADLD